MHTIGNDLYSSNCVIVDHYLMAILAFVDFDGFMKSLFSCAHLIVFYVLCVGIVYTDHIDHPLLLVYILILNNDLDIGQEGSFDVASK